MTLDQAYALAFIIAALYAALGAGAALTWKTHHEISIILIGAMMITPVLYFLP